jgi:hypothetical protein
MFNTRRHITVGLAAVAASAAFATSASAAGTTGDQLVGGTTLSTLSLGVSTPAVLLTGFAPGGSASGTGAVVVTSTNPWNLKAADGTANAGHLGQTGGTCTGSEATTANALSVTTTGVVPGNTTSTGAVSLNGTPQKVAGGVFADTLTNAYTLALGDTEALLTGCVYGTTITYTVQ